MSESVAEQPAALRSMLDSVRGVEPGVAEVIELAWAHPDEWADGEFDDVLERHLDGEIDDRIVGVTRVAFAAGVTFEQAHPAGRRDEWPVSLPERSPDDDGGEDRDRRQ